MVSLGERLRGSAASCAIGTLGALVRLGFVLWVHPPSRHVVSDMWVYDHRARNLLSGALTAWDTFTPCGYPALLALVYRLVPPGPDAVGVLQARLGGACAALTHRIGTRMWAGGLLPVLAGLACALHLPLVLYSGLLLTESISALLVVASAWLLLRAFEVPSGPRLALFGLTLGVATVVRPNLLTFYPLLAWVLRSAWPTRRTLLALALIGLGALPAIAPAAWHNSRLLGAPNALGTNGGLNFYLNFSDVRTIRYRDRMNDHAITPLPNLLRNQRDERTRVALYDDGYYYRRGLAVIMRRPSSLLHGLRNMQDGAGMGALSYWPGWAGHERLLEAYSRGFFFVAIAPALLWVLFLGVRGRLWRPAWRVQLVLGSLALSSAVVMFLFLGDPRIRVPFDPLIILLALDACAALPRSWTSVSDLPGGSAAGLRSGTRP